MQEYVPGFDREYAVAKARDDIIAHGFELLFHVP